MAKILTPRVAAEEVELSPESWAIRSELQHENQTSYCLAEYAGQREGGYGGLKVSRVVPA